MAETRGRQIENREPFNYVLGKQTPALQTQIRTADSVSHYQ